MVIDMNTQALTIVENNFFITADDGYMLSARCYSAPKPVANIIVAGATGVPQEFYRRFAQYAAQKGYTTITFDYRGIGRSKIGSLKGFNASFLDWAKLDLKAVVESTSHPEIPLYMVGHSFGGHAFGLIPNHYKIQKFYTFATGAGWSGWMPKTEALRVQVMWNMVLPTLTKLKGYTPMSMLGMGEDLPYGVYAQWKHWCKNQHYFFDDPTVPEITKSFTQIRTPIVAANATDDLWATPRSRDAFMQGYKNAPVICKDISLTSSMPKIGHMGYFRAHAVPLWDEVLDWFNL